MTAFGTLGLYLRGTHNKVRTALRQRRLRQMASTAIRLIFSGKFLLLGRKLSGGLMGQSAGDESGRYLMWRRHHAISNGRRVEIRKAVASTASQPVISLLVWIQGHSSAQHLSVMFESILGQLYPHWQLIALYEANIGQPERAIVERFVRSETRIAVVECESGQSQASSLNLALGEAQGDYIGLLGEEDELAEHALFSVAEAVQKNPAAGMLYSDEDEITPDGICCKPFFKPDWSPEYFQCTMYTGGLSVYRKSLVGKLGGFRDSFGPACEYDLALRVTSATSSIVHISDVLYHKRQGVTLQRTAEAQNAGGEAVTANLAAMGKKVLRIEPGMEPGSRRVRFAIIGEPKVSIVIPTACKEGDFGGDVTWYLLRCLESIEAKSDYTNYEVVVADNGDMPPELAEAIGRFNPIRVSYMKPGPFSLSAKLNFAAEHASGTHIILLNDDIEVLSSDWINSMLEYSQQNAIGAVGCRLSFPDARLQHAGIVLYQGGPAHPFYQYPVGCRGYHNSVLMVRNCVAVTGACLMTRKSLYKELGGFAEYLPLDYNDVDYCLRLIQRGYRVVYTPHAHLHHYEWASRSGNWESGVIKFHELWAKVYPQDPYYSRHLSQTYHDYRIALPWLGVAEA